MATSTDSTPASGAPVPSSPSAPTTRQARSPVRTSLVILAVLVIGGIVLAIYAPSLVAKRTDSQYSQVASDLKAAVTQALAYASAKGSYPTSLKVLRDANQATAPDLDPWGNPYMLAPVLAQGGTPQVGDDVYMYSKGPRGAGVYTPEKWEWSANRTAITGGQGAAGYSSIYGAFKGL